MYTHDDLVAKYLGNDWKVQAATCTTVKAYMLHTRQARADIIKDAKIEDVLTFYMGKNTPDRQDFIIDNLKFDEAVA